MTDSTSLNHQIEEAIQKMQLEEARTLLQRALPDANADTFYLASLAAPDEEQKLAFLEKALHLDPLHSKAYKAKKALTKPAERHISSRPANKTETDQTAAIPPSKSPHSGPTPAEPEPTPVQPAPEPVPESATETAYTARIQSAVRVTVESPEAKLYPTPREQRRKGQLLQAGTELDVISVDPTMQWLNVGFKKQGRNKIGWVMIADVSKPVQDGRITYEFSDLPLSRFEYNNAKELNQIHSHFSAQAQMGVIAAGMLFAVVIYFLVSSMMGAIFGSLAAAATVIGSMNNYASKNKQRIRTRHILEMLKRRAPKTAPSEYQPYTGWDYPTVEDIDRAEHEYDEYRAKSRQNALAIGVLLMVIAFTILAFVNYVDFSTTTYDIFSGTSTTTDYNENAIDWAIRFICLLAVIMAWPVVEFLAVYATDEEKALALTSISVMGTVIAVSANKARAEATQRRQEREAEEARQRAVAEHRRKQAEAERKRKQAEAEHKRKQAEETRNQEAARKRQEQSRQQQKARERNNQPAFKSGIDRRNEEWERSHLAPGETMDQWISGARQQEGDG